MRVLLAEETPAARDQAKNPRDGDSRVEIRGSDPLTSRGGGELALRGANVGTAAQQCAGVADRQGLRQRRIRSRREIDVRLMRAVAGQNRQTMLTLADGGSNGRKTRVDAGDPRRGPGPVELLSPSGVAPQ